MNKTENLLNPIGKYLRELSVIVAGIAITVTTGLWINDRNDARNIDLYLENIRMELQNNLDDIYMVKEYYDFAARYADCLLTNKMQNLHPDTLSQYADLTKALPFFTYRASAFDMFKASGMMRLIKDKNKVMSIWNCYDALEFLKMTNDFYIQRKVAVIENSNGFATGNIEQKALFGFFTNGMVKNWAMTFATYSKHIEETIAQLEDYFNRGKS